VCTRFGGEYQEKKPLPRPRHKLENIKTDFKKDRCGLDLNGYDNDKWWALVSTAMKFRLP
jgi:hypothetical protein